MLKLFFRVAGKSGGGRVYEMKIKLISVLVEVEFRLRWAKFGKSNEFY